MQKLETILAQTAAPKVPEWPSYNNFCKVNSSLRFKSAKETLRQMALSSYLHALIAPRLEKILAKTAAPKVPEQPSYGNFEKVTQKRALV